MRSVFSPAQFLPAGSIASLSGARPEAVWRVTILHSCQLLALAGFCGLPFGIYLLGKGVSAGLVMAFIALGAGMAGFALCRAQSHERAAMAPVAAMLGFGLVMGLADPAAFDLGLALALLAPVHASLVGSDPNRKLVWAGAAAVSVLALAGLPGAVARIEHGPLAAIALALCLGLVALAASRLKSGVTESERAQAGAVRHLIENAQDGLIRFDPSGEMIFVSRASETLFGCRRYELAGSGLTERLHVLDRPNFLTAFADAQKSGKARSVEVRIRRDGPNAGQAPQFVWVEVSLSPLVEGAGTAPHEVVALFRDVSDRKDQEQRMRLAQKSAEDASEAKSRFLATMGHELRTPLNAIVGFSEMMSSGIGGELSPAHREYAELIHKSGHHLLEVVGMLLDMSKIEAGKFELQTEAFAPEELLKPSMQMVDAMARAKNVRLSTDVPGLLPALTGDERACRQILINLLSNAIKFSQPGSTVTVGLRRQGQSLVLSVTDRGIGMSSETLQRLGEPFFQAQDNLARGYEGTGLGLSIVKGLVDLHGGSMRAISEPGEGTTMSIFLPLSGPALQSEEVASVTPLRRDTRTQHSSPWPDLKRKAQ